MARGKKKEKELTIEEKLEQALVPVEEQPYKVPENWCWTYIKFAYEVTSSKRVHKEDWLSEGIPFYRTREIVKLSNQGYVNNELFISDELYKTFKATYGVPQIGDLLISGVGTIGVPYIIESDNPLYFKDGNVIWLKNKRLLDPKYTYYLYKSNYMDNMIHSMSSGTTVDTYTIVNANATPIPLPTPYEQQRIVDRIESLFAKLDEAKEKAQAVVDGFETRKAAILHKAFTGELTEQWRRNNSVCIPETLCKEVIDKNLVPEREQPYIIPDSWSWVFMGAIGYTGIGLTYKPSDKTSDGTIVLRSSNIQNGRMDYGDVVKVSMEIPVSKMCKKGDILICARNGSKALVGKTAIVDADGMSYGAFMAIFRSNFNHFVFYYLNSPFFRNIIDKDVGTTTINQVTQSLLKKLPFPFAPLEEQSKIVNILDKLLLEEQQTKTVAEVALNQIETLKKSILARAFRGELGTNDPTEENAVELLKKVL